MKLEPGSKIGPYEIVTLIGAGGMGEVYRARDPNLNRDVAIKILLDDISTGEKQIARFENEARLASSLNHPNIITIYSMGRQNQHCYIAMELIYGQTLQELTEKGPMPVEQALKIAAQVADGLAKAHDAGIVHRDLKPQNVMVTKDGHVKILDFGLSKLIRFAVDSVAPTESAVGIANRAESLTQSGTILGTVDYMSPEQAAGRPVDYRSDQFSMGSLMYAILTGNRPFNRESAVQTLIQIIEGEPRPIDELNPRVPATLQAVIRRCLMKNPRDRYQSTQELAHDLQQLELDSKVPLRRWTRRDRIRALFGLLILLVVLGSIWIWNQRTYHPEPAAVEWYQKGLSAMHSMSFDSARRAFDQAVALDSKFVLAQASLARAYAEMDYSEQAKELMLKATVEAQEINLSGIDMQRLRVLQYMVSRQYELAVPLQRQLEQSVDKQDKPAAAFESGWLAETQGDTEGAVAAYERALEMDPGYAAAKLRLGCIGQYSGEDKLALESFTEAENLYRAMSNSEGVSETLYQQANFLNRRSRPAEAMEIIDEAIALVHAIENRYQEIRLLLLQSAVVRKQGESVRAGELAQQAIDAALKEGMNNLATSGMMALGNALWRGGDLESAEKNFRDALDIAQRYKLRHYEALVTLSLGSLFEQKNQPEQARQFIEAAQSFSSYNQDGYNRESVQAKTLLGSILHELGEYEEGIKVLKDALSKAIKVHDTETELGIRDRLAELLQAQGNWPEALKESEKSINLPISPTENVYSRLICAGLFWRLGRWKDAERSLAEVESLLQENTDPSTVALLRLRQAEMAYARGHFEEARTHAQKAISAVPAAGDLVELDARLIEALVLIRTGRRNEDIQSTLQLIRDLEESKLAGNAAYARLAIAEALAGTGESNLARTMTLDALTFFEQHSVWESSWRAHLVAAQVSQESADISTHRNSARSALTQMRNLWPANDVDSYLQRPDIKRLYGDMQF
jgi:serine/threonine protein kinase